MTQTCWAVLLGWGIPAGVCGCNGGTVVGWAVWWLGAKDSGKNPDFIASVNLIFTYYI